MPRLACWSCGRQIYTVAPLESLFAEERRCPRCGAFLRDDRREGERRQSNRRVNPPHDPGPPKPKATRKGGKKGATEEAGTDGERRVADRRTTRRRDSGTGTRPRPATNDNPGWRD
jgi:hypothetical protein